ncbi:MAG: hypothetical protein IKV82_02305 [Akkermansia sp.]|nr:hypothetical protein [Akkermansia sp.]
MKIKPVKNYPVILPAAAALMGSIVAGCDRQNVKGSEPGQTPRESEQQPVGRYLISPSPAHKKEAPQPENPSETNASSAPDETPQKLGGDEPYCISPEGAHSGELEEN